MATNPDNAIGTNGAYGGRTSVNALNDVLSVFNGRGVIQGWELLPSAGMTITAGGDGSTRDVAIAEDNIGNRTTINNISEQPVPVTIPAAPASNSRIDLVVAYVDNPPQGASTATDNYGACGIIVVSGTAAASPTAPEDADIRSAITADGGAGTVAYYVVLGSITVASGTTDIDSSMITNGGVSAITSHNIDYATLGNATKTYFVPSTLDVTASTNDIAGQTSMTLTTSNGGSAILVTVEAVMGAVGGQDFYPRVVVDGTNYSLATRNLQGNIPYTFSRIIPNLSAGSHTISFGLSPNGTVRFTAYNDIRITATEIATPIK